MGKGVLFWVLMVVAFVFGLFGDRFDANVRLWGNTLLLFILLALLGWGIYGPAVQ
jgi:hypothetical protein